MSTEETNGVEPKVHASPIASEAVDASGVQGGVTTDGAFVPADEQVEVAEEVADEETEEEEEVEEEEEETE